MKDYKKVVKVGGERTESKAFMGVAILVIILLACLAGMGINYYLENRSSEALIEIGALSQETSPEPIKVMEEKLTITDAGTNFTFYEDLANDTSAVTVSAEPITPDNLVEKPVIVLRGKKVELKGSLRCLAMNVYLEGRNRSDKMQEAVAWTTINRVGKYGNENVCDVITNARIEPTSGLIYKDKCHFSWYCDSRTVLQVAENQIEDKAYRKAVKIASYVLAAGKGSKLDFTHGATHYHKDTVSPWWEKDMDKMVASYADHKFYIGH